MKLALTQDMVFKMSLERAPVPDSKPMAWKPFDGPNYLAYDDHRDAPPGFALRVGKKASIYLVDKLVAGKKLKIHVGLASGKKGDERPMPLTAARERAWSLIQDAKRLGANPKGVAEKIAADELTMKDVWDGYLAHLKKKQPPIKPNSLASLDTARAKLSDWEGRKVRSLTSKEVLERFDLHASTKNHPTAAEAMGRWATAAIDKAIEIEVHEAHAQGRSPGLAYNPFSILRTEERYRSRHQLERIYKAKGIRNPMSFDTSVGPFVKEAWAYRRENPVAADFLLLTLLWGMRRGESATFKWRDRISQAETLTESWVDMARRCVCVTDGKSRADHEFPIAPFAFEILKLRRAAQPEDMPWVFPTRSPASARGCYSDPQVALRTIRDRAGIATLRGHDFRRTFGAACEKLGFSDRQTKRMLGHAVGSGESVNRYTDPEWIDLQDRMRRVEELVMSSAPSVYNALRPKSLPRVVDSSSVAIPNKAKKRSRARAR